MHCVLTQVALLRDKLDPRTYKLRSALLDVGQAVTEFVRMEPYDSLFTRYHSPSSVRFYRFFYDGGDYEFLLRHLELVNIPSYRRLSQSLKDEGFGVLHCNSVTEHLASGLVRWGSLPVITEVYDVTSLYEIRNIRILFSRHGRKLNGPRKWVLEHVTRNILRWEQIAHERSAGLVYTSETMLKYVRSKYSIVCPAVVVPNAVYGKLLPRGPAPEKFSVRDGGIHLVYTGVIRDSLAGHHRDICEQLNELSKGDVITHIYPIIPEEEKHRVYAKLRENRNIRWHRPLAYEDLYRELGQYDAGLVVLAPYDRELLDVALPNKLYEYVAAGLPVLVSPYPPLLDFIKKYNCGIPLPDAESIGSLLHHRRVAFRPEFTIEYYIPNLVDMYSQLAG